MIGRERLLATLSSALKRADADAASFCAHGRTRQVFRFAHSGIHQDIRQEVLQVTARVVRNHAIGVASTDLFDRPHLIDCLKRAGELASLSPKQDPLFPMPDGHRIRSLKEFHAATAELAPLRAVEAIQQLMRFSQGVGAQLAGSLTTGTDELAVVNTAKTICYSASTLASAKLVTFYRDLSGYASGTTRAFEALPLAALLEESLRQALHRAERVQLPLGTYEVVLGPEAVADLTDWLGLIAFGAKSMQERTSFLAGRLGESVMDKQLTLYDDGTEDGTLRTLFDFEGTPKRRTLLIDRGRAAGIVYDSLYGARFAHPSTGNALPPDDDEGPLPLHLAIEPGDTTREQMIRSCAKGLLIPRFHYVSGLLNPREALMTGLTREGAFLIEDGKITQPIGTARFTDSLLTAFGRIRGISKERRIVADPNSGLGCALMPSLHLAALRFTGRSDA